MQNKQLPVAVEVQVNKNAQVRTVTVCKHTHTFESTKETTGRHSRRRRERGVAISCLGVWRIRFS